MSGFDTREKVCPPVRGLAPLASDLTHTEQRVTDAFFRGIPPMVCHGGTYRGGAVTLDVQYLGHRQSVRGRTLIEALAEAQRVYDALHVPTGQEAA